jgi:hypothetical protein
MSFTLRRLVCEAIHSVSLEEPVLDFQEMMFMLKEMSGATR